MTRNSRKKTMMIVNIVVIVGLLGVSGYLFTENRDLKQSATLSQEDKLKQENDKLIADVSKLMDLPKDEPTIFKVNDPEKTEEGNPGISELFSDLQKDDYLLVYKNDRLGIQYRPSQNKIIKTATLTLPVSIEVFGSEKAVAEMEKKLQELYGNRVVVSKQTLSGVTQSFVYDKTTKLKTEVEALAKEISYEVGSTLPESVKPGSATEVVIVIAEAKTAAPEPVEAAPAPAP
jgi:hypothetical protein